MQVTVDSAQIWVAVGGLVSVAAWAVRVVATRHLALLDKTTATQEKIVATQETHTITLARLVEGQAVTAMLSRVVQVVSRSNPDDFKCDDCGGWEGPEKSRPSKVPNCSCPVAATAVKS